MSVSTVIDKGGAEIISLRGARFESLIGGEAVKTLYQTLQTFR